MKKMIIVTVVLTALLLAVLNCGAESDDDISLYSEEFALAEAKYGISGWGSDELYGLYDEVGGLGYWNPNARMKTASFGKWMGKFFKQWIERHQKDLKKLVIEFGKDFVMAVIYRYFPGLADSGIGLTGFKSSSTGSQVLKLICTE